MPIQSFGAKLLSDLVPRLREAGEQRLKAAPKAMAPDLLTLDRKAIEGLDRDAVDFIAKTNEKLAKRDPIAVEAKYKNMAKSPARFLSGQPELMAHDLRDLAQQLDAPTIITGDMHLRNLGTVLKTNGKIKYRFNDFDEATVGPAALDFNRMATHMVLEGRELGHGNGKTRKLVESFAGSYYDTLAKLAAHPGEKVKVAAPDVVKDAVKKVSKRDPEKWLAERAPLKHGQRQLVRNSWNLSVDPQTSSAVTRAVEDYRKSLPTDAARQLEGYRVTDVTAIHSGTGSAGQDRFHVLLQGGKKDEPILLQLKAQTPSAFDAVLSSVPRYPSQAVRNVALGDALDAGLDPLRGVTRIPGLGANGDMLVERLTPAHSTLELENVGGFGNLRDLVTFDGAQAAKAHARGATVGLAGASDILKTLGPRDQFVQGLVDFAHQYADQTERDHKAFVKALRLHPLLA